MKKLLFVSARLPYPATEGHQIRSFGVLKELSKNYEIHLLSILRDSEEINVENELGKICKSIQGVPCLNSTVKYIYPALKALVKRLPLVVTKYVTTDLIDKYVKSIKSINPDIVHLDLFPLSYLINYTPNNIPTVINEHNIESSLIKQKLSTINNYFLKYIYIREYNLLRKYEQEMTSKSSLTLVCSNNDKEALVKFGSKNIVIIPNGIDTDYLIPPVTQTVRENKLVFIGGMSWYPNRIGMTWFINNVFPLILSKVPDVSLDIIGNPEPRLSIPKHLTASINIKGFVDDFREDIYTSKVMIVPLTLGSGTRLKVLEGMAMKKCIVSTSIGAEGIDVIDNVNILIADKEDEFCNSVIECLNSDAIRNKIESNAVELAVKKYDWNVIGKDLLDAYNNLI